MIYWANWWKSRNEMEKLSAKRLFILQPYSYALKPSQVKPSHPEWNDFFFLLLGFCFFVTLSNSFWLEEFRALQMLFLSLIPECDFWTTFSIDSIVLIIRHSRENYYNLNFSIKLNSLALIIPIKCCVRLRPLAHNSHGTRDSIFRKPRKYNNISSVRALFLCNLI